MTLVPRIDVARIDGNPESSDSERVIEA